ncbi:hypothetical protein L1987_56705 [Smallanthus sonchifolius]|uniref:Uncharacterized protein n=1 Tax=Smallanthus sonchifolius TaxID=185202 RepID=A0ACB9EEK1_9ASTR|nr:hypothetical protein L1987_56705 [Smallanthus sonchifolius]
MDFMSLRRSPDVMALPCSFLNFNIPLSYHSITTNSKPTSLWAKSVKKFRSILKSPRADGGLGMALLSVTSTAKVRISPFVSTLAANPTFVSGFLAWLMAQSLKVVLHFCFDKKLDLRIMRSSDSLFPVSLGFSLIVMYDAFGVRRHAGMQAEVLNVIVEDLFQGHPISKRKLKELLGHTPSQIQRLSEERKALIKGQYREKHFNAGSILLAFGVFESIGGGLNTYLRTGKLFPGPHLYAGAAITVL